MVQSFWHPPDYPAKVGNNVSYQTATEENSDSTCHTPTLLSEQTIQHPLSHTIPSHNQKFNQPLVIPLHPLHTYDIYYSTKSPTKIKVFEY